MTRDDGERRTSLGRRALRFVVTAIEEYGRGIAVAAPDEIPTQGKRQSLPMERRTS